MQVCLHCGEDFCRGDCLKYHYDQSQREKKEPVEDLVVDDTKKTVDEEDEEEKEKRPRMKRQTKRRPRSHTAGSISTKTTYQSKCLNGPGSKERNSGRACLCTPKPRAPELKSSVFVKWL